MDKKASPKPRSPRANLDDFQARDNERRPRLPDGQAQHHSLFPVGDPNELDQRFWGNARPPSTAELERIKTFGQYPTFDPNRGKLSARVALQIADLKEATRVIVYHHYLHRGRTMAQLPYWVLIDGVPVGVILYSLPRLSVPLRGIPPMNVLELARLWLSPDIQNRVVTDSAGQTHSVAVASCAVGKSIRRVQADWFAKYPRMPDILAVVSWADVEHHEGTIYKAANFEDCGLSGGSMHGNRRRPNGGRDQWNIDYAHLKTLFMYRFRGPLPPTVKKKLAPSTNGQAQLRLFE